MKIGISTTFNYDIPLDTMLTMLVAAGFEAVSLGGKREHSNYHLPDGRRHILELLLPSGLVLDSIHAPFKNVDGDLSTQDEAVRRQSVANIKNAIDVASELKAPIVIIHLNARFTGPATRERLSQVMRSVREIFPYAQTKGIKLACENLDTLAKQTIFETVLSEFTQPHIGVCYDSSHERLVGTNFNILERYRSRIFAVHIADDIQLKDDHLLPFEGKIDWAEFSRIFKKINYTGVFLLEPEMRLSGFKEPSVFLKEAYARAQRLLE